MADASPELNNTAIAEAPAAPTPPQEDARDCNICFSSKSFAEFGRLSCSHSFCRDCLAQTFESHALRLGVKTQFFCPECSGPITTEEALANTSDDFRRKYAEWVAAASFVPSRWQQISEVWERYRPGGKAKSGAKAVGNALLLPFRIIFVALMVIVNCLPDRNTLWLSLWTKRCPNCHIHVEKDGGCKHMSCRACNIHFCWHCGKTANDSSPIYSHVCTPWGFLRMSGPIGVACLMLIVASVLRTLQAVSWTLNQLPIYPLVAPYAWAATCAVASWVYGWIAFFSLTLPFNIVCWFVSGVTPTFVAELVVNAGIIPWCETVGIPMAWEGAYFVWGLAWTAVDFVLGGIFAGLHMAFYFAFRTILWRCICVHVIWNCLLGGVVYSFIPEILCPSFLTQPLTALLWVTVVGVPLLKLIASRRNSYRRRYY